MTWEPIAHRPPLRPIDIAPRAPVTVAEPKTFWEIQAEADEARRRLERGERIWRAVVASAEASNMTVPVPAQSPPSDQDMSGVQIRDVWREAIAQSEARVHDAFRRPAQPSLPSAGELPTPEEMDFTPEDYDATLPDQQMDDPQHYFVISPEMYEALTRPLDAAEAFAYAMGAQARAEPEKRTTGHGCETGAGFNTDDWSARYREAAEQLWRNREGE